MEDCESKAELIRELALSHLYLMLSVQLPPSHCTPGEGTVLPHFKFTRELNHNKISFGFDRS